MPLYAGFDIGIKNLAFCIIDSEKWDQYINGYSNDPGIVLWQNLNLVGESKKCVQLIKSGKNKGAECGKAARWKSGDSHYCGTHKPDNPTKYKQPQLKNINMSLLKKTAFQELDKISLFHEVKCIALESQPRINQKMKMFGASIEAYFIIRQQLDKSIPILKTIKASPAKNKLKVYSGPPISCGHFHDPYDKRKYLAQKHTEWFLERSPEILEQYFYNNKKRDDLADAFLHCLCAMS